MLWVWLTLIAVNLWALSSIIDKHVVSKYLRKPEIAIIIFGFVSLFAGLAVLMFNGIAFQPIIFIIISFISGIIGTFSTVIYFKAVKIEEISRVIALIYLLPLFVLILATIFLNEIFTLYKYMGIFLLIIGAILISYKKGKIAGKFLTWMILFSILAAIGDILIKYSLNFIDFWSVFAWSRFGLFIGSLFILYYYFHDFIAILHKRRKAVEFLTMSEILSMFGGLISIIALSVGFVSLVVALQSIQPFFVLLYATLISIFAPKILKEELKGSVIFIKIIAILFMFIGAYLII